jgi:hypothetical protein
VASAVTVHAAAQSSPYLNFCDGQALAGGLSSGVSGTPLALASGDFDADGVPDLVSGFGSGNGGSITVHRGNVQALWPYGAALRNGPPPAFLPNARTFSVPEAPELIATGDFDVDGRWDIVTAKRGSDAIYMLKGDGRGGFYAARRIAVAGQISDMIQGEINRADGLADLILAVNTAAGSRVLVYESPTGAITATPEIIKIGKPVTSMALGRFDGEAMQDLAVAAGNQLVVIHARDRKLSLGENERSKVAKAAITVQELSFAPKTLVAGNFSGSGPGVAALDERGTVHILDHAIGENSLAANLANQTNPSFQFAHSGDQDTPAAAGRVTPAKVARAAASRNAIRTEADSPEWTERGTVSLPGGFSQSAPRLVTGHLTGTWEDDIVAVDSGNSKVHVLSTGARGGRARAAAAGFRAEAMARFSPAPMSVVASLDAVNAPVAVLPMRLNQHGLSGLVMLHEGQSAPTVMPQDVAPTNIFTVTNTSDAIIDGGNTQKTGPAGSLRKAMYDAQQASGNNGGGTYEIAFNIPTTDPGYNPATGAFKIQPLSESVPGALNDFALGPINATLIIDGYTQPGASPNTLATGSNARILIQIDGGKATTPGGSGLVPFDDVGSVFRGLDFTGWVNPEVTSGSHGSTASGAEGIEANGVGDFIEGNFFGTDPTGKTAAPNRIGVFADNGPGFGSAPGNIIGGTTPQARNILSGNNNSGILFLSTAYEAQLQGNIVGLDVTGNAIVSNPQEADRSNTFDGVGLNGQTVTIGGTLPGATNVIAGNGTNVDINDLTEGNQAKNSTVQGNLIGTNASGTAAIANQGYGVSILHNPQNMTIGGTTAAARNIISGNLAGVYVFDNSFYNIVQGNYIGTDITGTKAVPNVGAGFTTGATDSSEISAGDTTIGGSVAGAGNLISGNTTDGVLITGTSNGPTGGLQSLQGNTIQGNLIGTDVTGNKAIPNGGNGINLSTSATNNIVGGTAPGAGNMIANNKGQGVLIDPGTANPGQGVGNNTVSNTILSNAGAGVRVKSGTSNRISQNSIYGNKALGIDIDATGPTLNSHCNATSAGANGDENAPTLTAGSGTAFISATATDPSGNTSEFSNSVKSSTNGSVISLLGTFDGKPSTTFTIEFFSSPAADASGFGQGQTYLGSTTVTTGADCTSSINDPVDTSQADVSVTIAASTNYFQVGPDFGQYSYTGTVANNGAAAAHNTVFTDILPAGLEISNAYCNTGPCQTPVMSTLGSCTVNQQTLTCNLGTMAPGATATITIPVQATKATSIANTVTVKATETDPKPANNTASITSNVTYPFPFIDHINPISAVVQSTGSLPMTIYGSGFLPISAVTFNDTAVPTTGYLDNQVCGLPFNPAFCSAIQISIPASLLGTAGTDTITVTNPDPGIGGGGNFPSSTPFTLVASCTTNAEFFGFNPVEAEGDTLIPESVEVTANAPTCPWTATSQAAWLTILDNAKGTGSGSFDVAVAPNTGAARSGTVTVNGQTVEIDQAAPDAGETICTYGLNPASAHIPAAGLTGSFAVTTASNCSYFVEPYPQDSTYLTGVQFITIPQSSGLLVGNGNPQYTVAPNHGAARTGAIMVGGDVFTLTQDAPTCYYTLDKTSADVGASGGSGAIGVTASGASCAWTAKSSDTSHLSVTSGATGTGNGTVRYTVPANTSGPETPTITIGDANGYSIFTVNLASAFTCSFTISPSPKSVGANGTTDFFTLTASFSFCKWTANSNDPAALSINGATSGTGTAAIYYAVGQNATGSPRVLTVTAGCQTFTVNQSAPATASNNPVPTITSLSPSSAAAGSGAFTLTVNGTGFVNGSTVNFNGQPRTTTFVSATQLTAAIPASDVATAGTPAVTVITGAPGGGTSNSVNFTISTASNPAPAITSLAPASIAAGSASFTLTVNGTNFISASVINFNGVAQATTFVSATQVKATIAASAVTTAGTAPVTVTNPAPGGGTSTAVNFTISAANNPAPAITSLAPASIAAGSASFTLTVNGTGFISNSVINFNGVAQATTFVSATQVKATIAASAVTTAGTTPVTVTNPAPGGGTSSAVNFTISAANNPSPTVTSISPSTVTAGSGAFTLTVNGTGFVGNSVVNFKGSARPTTYVSATQVTAAIPATDIATAGSAAITVTNPTPGGGTSNSVNLTINVANNPAPAITALTPSSVTVGSATFQLTVSGTGFVNASVVKLNGAALATVFASATQLTATVPAADLTAVGTAQITVTSPAPGGGTSNALTLTIAGKPALTVSPTSLTFPSTVVGSSPATQTVTLSSNGTAAVGITGITIGGANPANFSQTNTCGTSVAVGASCTITVKFAPTAAGSLAATLSIADNVAGSPQAVTLAGTATPAPAPVVTLTPSSLTFSAVTGTTTAAQTATIKNTGTALLSLTGISMTGSGAAAFAETNTCGASLDVNASCTVSVTFSPGSVASFSAAVSIADNASGSPQTIALTGSGTPAPSFTVASTSTLQTVMPGGAATYTVTVAAQNGNFPNAVTLAASGLPPGATATFAPPTITPGGGSKTSTLTIQTAAVTAANGIRSRWMLAALALPFFGLFYMARRFRQRWIMLVLLLLTSFGAAGALSGCGGGFNFSNNNGKTYTITITGTSGAVQQTTTVQLKVQ